MAQRKGIIPILVGSSFLMVLVFILLFLYFNAASVYGSNVDNWRQVIQIYLTAFSLVLILGLITAPKIVRALAKVSYWKAFVLRFIPSALISTAILLLFQLVIKGPNSIDILTAISYVSLTALVFHLFVVSQIEEIMFRGILFETVYQKSSLWAAYIITAFTFAIFHYFTSGGSWIVMATYVPLSFAWTYIKFNGYPWLNHKFPNYFGPTRLTQQANAGSHFAWNIFILGFIKPFQA